MKYPVSLALASALFAASSASAQSSGPFSGPSQFFIDGYVDLSYFDASGGQDGTLFRSEVDLGFRPEGDGLGFELGLDGYWLDSSTVDDDNTAIYPAVTLNTAFGQFSAGIPRSVLDRGYAADTVFARSSLLDLQLNVFTDSFLGSAYLTSSETPYGLRYDGEFGATKIGLSYHQIDLGGGDIDNYALALRHEFDAISSFYDFALFGGFEHVTDATTDVTNYTIGAEGGADDWTVGLQLTDNELIGDSRIAEVYADYTINDFTISGSVLDVNPGFGPSISYYGVGAEYRFLQNAYVDASIVDSDATGFERTYEVSLGWRF